MPVVIGAALAGIGYAAFTTAAAFSTMALFSAIMIGASIGSLFLQNDINDYNNNNSPTYSMGEIHNTMSQNVPIPIIYGGNMRVAGNIIYQAFDSNEKKVQTLYVLLSEGEIQDVTDIKANDQLISDLPDCSVSVYKNTTSSTRDSRDPGGESSVVINMPLKDWARANYPRYKSEWDSRELTILGPYNVKEYIKNKGYNLQVVPDETIMSAYWSRYTVVGYGGDAKYKARPYPNNVALLCMTLTASDKLSGSPTITSIVKGVKVWTPSGRIWTTNPIWCAIDLLANPRYGMGLCTYDGSGNYDHPDWDKIDYSYALQAANICDGYIDNDKRFELTYILDTQKPIKEALQDMLQTCRGYIVENDKIEIHIETAVNNASHAITENNIVQGSFTWWQKTDNNQANQVCLTWTDPDNNYDQVTDVYQNDPDIADRGLVTQNYTMVGIAKQSQANRMGYYLLKTNLLVRNLCSFRVGIKDIDIRPGQVIAITFTSFTGWNNKWFRVISTKIENETEMTVVCGEYIAECYDDGSIEVAYHIDTNKTLEVSNVTGLQITSLDTGAIKISWQAQSAVNGYELSYKIDNGAWIGAGFFNSSVSEYVFTPEIANVTSATVTAKVITVGVTGRKSSGVSKTQTLSCANAINLAITEEVTVTNNGQYKDTAIITWTPPQIVSSIEVWYRFDSESAYTLAASLPQGSTEYRLDITTHNVVTVKIVTVSKTGLRSTGIILRHYIVGDTTPPAAPTNVVATTGYHLCTLTWSDPSDNDLDHVIIYRCGTADGEFVKTGEVKRGMQEYTDNNIYTPWYYKLKAVDTAGNTSVWSEMVTADRTPPAVPTNLTGSSGYRLVNVTWTDPADGDLDHIVIYRSSDGVTYNACGQANKGEQLFIDANLAIVTTYWHKVKAVDWLGNESALTSPVSTTTEAIPMPEIPEQSITATKIADGAITTPKLAANCITGNQIAANVQIAIGNGGELVMGDGSILQMASGVFILNSENGHLQIRDPNDIVNGDYVDISNGQLATYHKFSGDSAHSRVKSLQNIEPISGTQSMSRVYTVTFDIITTKKWTQIPECLLLSLSFSNVIGASWSESHTVRLNANGTATITVTITCGSSVTGNTILYSFIVYG